MNNFTPNKYRVKLFSQPHKPFFLAGIVNAIVYMMILFLHFSNLFYINESVFIYHVYTFMFIVFTQFFTAFLFTTFPRFLSTPPIEEKRYVRIFYILNGFSLLFIISLYFNIPIFISMLGIFAANLMILLILDQSDRVSKLLNKYDTNWILRTFKLGLAAHILFIASALGFDMPSFVSSFAVNISFFLYSFMLILTISQKMIPFFTSKKVSGYMINKSKNFLEIVFVLLSLKVLSASFYIEKYFFIIDLLLFAVMVKELLLWKLPTLKSPSILWVLHISLYWIPIGFLIFFIDNLMQFAFNGNIVFEKTAIHFLAIGYFTTILIGFGTRIILGHSGRTPEADAFTVKLFFFIQFLVVFRVFAGFILNFDSTLYIDMILASSILWIILFILWSKRYISILFE